MRKILVLAISALFFASSIKQSVAADDVYVDLSVLEEIDSSGTSSVYGKPEPLFPVIKNTPQFPVVKKAEKKPAKSKASKKPQTKKTPKKVKTQEKGEKIVASEKKQNIVPEVKKPETNKSVESKTSTSVEKKVQEETLVVQPQKKAEEEAKNVNVITEEKKELAPQSEQKEMPFKPETPAPAEKITPAPVADVVAAPVNQAETVQKTETSVRENAPKIEPLVQENTAPKQQTNVEQIKREIVFAEGSDELDEIAKEKIDAIIASFDNAKVNKIVIMAYNYDNGEDVFRKKRQSLNRAIEIRSYLLGKGYKNFSIKVINITDDAAKGNIVEIDELK